MTAHDTTQAARLAQNPFSLEATKIILAAGVVGEIFVEFFAFVIAPLFLGRSMQPSVLIQNLAAHNFGVTLPISVAFLLHFIAGAYIFVVFYLYFCDATKVRSVLFAGTFWGLALWATAQGVLAPAAGRPFFLGFQPYTFWSIPLHLIYFVPTAFAIEFFAKRWNRAAG